MKKGKRLRTCFALWLVLLPAISLAQKDSLQLKHPEKTEQPQPDLRLETETKRQHNKTEKVVFVSCLFIVVTTILLYNVRSK